MKTMRWIMILTLVIMAGLVACTPVAKADANLMENGSVQYVYVSNADELRNQIDQNIHYASRDILEKRHEYTNVYKIIVENPGTLVICPLSNSYSMKFRLYSNFQLTSKIAETTAYLGDRNQYVNIHVDSGTYYYQCEREGGSGTAWATVYVAFIPDDGIIPEQQSGAKYIQDSEEIIPVEPAYLASCNELQDYIDADGEYASIDYTDLRQYSSPVYSVTVDSPGTLVFLTLTRSYNIDLYVYSNNTLSSLIGETEGASGNRGNYLLVNADKGTYYYQVKRDGGSGETACAVYVGFVSENGNNKTWKLSSAEDRSVRISPSEIESGDSFINMINNGKEDCKDRIDARVGKTQIYSFTIEESCYAYFWTSTESYHVTTYLYSNKDLTSKLLDIEGTNVAAEQNIRSIYLTPGTYYLQSERDGGSGSVSVMTYVAITPASTVFSIENIMLNDQKTEAKVVFNISEEYNPDLSRSMVRIREGIAAAQKLNNGEYWRDNTRETAIESHEFVAVKNGFYTARISGNGLKTYMFSFEVSGIESEQVDTEIQWIATASAKLNFREGPDSNATRIDVLNPGTEVYVYSTEKNDKGEEWSRIKYFGQEGYVMTDYLILTEMVKNNEQTTDSGTGNSPAQEDAETPAPDNESQNMTSTEMRKYIRGLEDQIEDLGLELPDFSGELTQDEYMKQLEQVLHDNGYNL